MLKESPGRVAAASRGGVRPVRTDLRSTPVRASSPARAAGGSGAGDPGAVAAPATAALSGVAEAAKRSASRSAEGGADLGGRRPADSALGPDMRAGSRAAVTTTSRSRAVTGNGSVTQVENHLRMVLVSPTLDDRSAAQLSEELRQRIAVFTPEWTDHNESDPGIALVELFAYLGESTIFRFNQLPDTTKIAFLRLLGVRPRPARPASALLAAGTDAAAGIAVERGTEVRAGSLLFSTTGATRVWPLEVVGVGKQERAPTADRADADRRSDALSRAGLADDETPVFYATTPVPADPLAPGAEPLRVSDMVDHALWLAVLRTRTTDVTALRGESLFVAVALDDDVERPFALEPRPADPARDPGALFASPGLTADPPPMLWRLWTPPGPSNDAFTVLDVGDDSTGGLVRSGVVELLLPPELPELPALPPGTGGADEPPPLDDPAQAERVVAWIQVTRPAGEHLGDGIRPVRWVGVNGVRVEHARSATPEELAPGTGDADQVRALARHPVLAGTTRLQVEENGTWREWTEVETHVVSGPDDRHYTVDLDAGTVRFGGLRVPQPGERIRVQTYRFGGGAVGNVAAGALSAVGVAGVKVANPLPASGGADAASLAESLDAIPAHVHRCDRAVTTEDFVGLAEQVSGVVRAEALDLVHPDVPHVASPGVVSVLVFPTEDLTSPRAPLPGFALLRRVAEFLDARRLVTTELYVVPPTYRRIAFSIGLGVRPGYQVDAVRRWVDTLLRQYLAPVPPLGPDGRGWPLGRAVRAAELEAVAVQVEGVEYVVGSVLGPVLDGTPGEPRDVVTLNRWEVPELAALVVTAGDPRPLGAAPRPAELDRVPVPLPPDEC